jgi:hypothetical protein
MSEQTSRILLFWENNESRDFLGLLFDETVLSCSSRELSDEFLLIIVMLVLLPTTTFNYLTNCLGGGRWTLLGWVNHNLFWNAGTLHSSWVNYVLRTILERFARCYCQNLSDKPRGRITYRYCM